MKTAAPLLFEPAPGNHPPSVGIALVALSRHSTSQSSSSSMGSSLGSTFSTTAALLAAAAGSALTAFAAAALGSLLGAAAAFGPVGAKLTTSRPGGPVRPAKLTAVGAN